MAQTLPVTNNLLALDLAGLKTLAVRLGEPPYRGQQLFEWVYGKGCRHFEAMTNLPVAFRARLEAHFSIRRLAPAKIQTSSDGTVKVLLTLGSGRLVEAVLIPEVTAGRFTACVSSQVGCAMGCTFCATGRMGFMQNLVPGEIYDQAAILSALAKERFDHGLTNIVFMGMGEPLLNYRQVMASVAMLTHPKGMAMAPRRITVSTVGLARRIRRLADEAAGVRLAVSLHAPTQDKRSQIMPSSTAEATDLGALMDSLHHYCRTTGKRLTFEYCLFREFNDHEDDARTLVRLCRRVRSKVNLIMYNAVPGVTLQRTTEARLNAFARVLAHAGVTVTVRRSRGQDIDAACGQLATLDKLSQH